MWPRLHRAILDAHGIAGQVDWSSVIVDAASLRAKKVVSHAGAASPTNAGGHSFLGFLCLAAAITCWQKLPTRDNL
ncbi:hypothetical protein [Frankia gtarii]|uniref:hypothetical protein n=1 Tax=Frankia gtarii TaxID=2950102 RepID=UPI0021C19BCC|nr:hypothetical protein [Frankia gtarii]